VKSRRTQAQWLAPLSLIGPRGGMSSLVDTSTHLYIVPEGMHGLSGIWRLREGRINPCPTRDRRLKALFRCMALFLEGYVQNKNALNYVQKKNRLVRATDDMA
jgi:hypothetical protein